MTSDFNADVQKLFLEIMLTDAESYVRVQNIYNSENFDKTLKAAAKFIKEYSDEHKAMPDLRQIHAVSRVQLEMVPDLNDSHTDWFLKEFESFTRRRELERAILQSADLLEKGDYDPVEKLIKDAVHISLTKDMGTDYFADPRSRLMALKDNNGQVSTGWVALDRKLFGGMNRGELNIFAGGSGSGKSLFMQNLAINWVTQGLSGAYITLELSEGLSAMRLDSMLTNMPSKEIFRNIDDVEMKVRIMGKKSGVLRIKYMPAQSNVNHIRAYLKELQIQTGVKVDFVLVDYLDLIMPVSAKVSPNDLFVKDKYVSEELRNLAKELNVLFVTASQLNRSAVEEIEFDHSHIAGGLSKINTADNVFGIFTSRAMRERGRYQLQLMKTRSSSGVGQKIDLEFDLNSLRIRDVEGGEESAQSEAPSSAIMSQIKARSQVSASNSDAEPEATASIQTNKIKDMLKNLRTVK
jgi:archaellum biogenesis ATPase FlaH